MERAGGRGRVKFYKIRKTGTRSFYSNSYGFPEFTNERKGKVFKEVRHARGAIGFHKLSGIEIIEYTAKETAIIPARKSES